MRNKYAAGLFFLLTIVAVQCAYSSGKDESVENASLLSKILDGSDTVVLTQACEYSIEDRSVNIDVDSSAEDAKKLCSEISAIVEYHDLVFAPGWTVQMTTPSTGVEVIAVCPL